MGLGSYGEGMRRLLALSLSLIRAEGGVLLVDEIDAGLHYSVTYRSRVGVGLTPDNRNGSSTETLF